MKHLPLYNQAYIQLEESFREWLNILGYASTTVYGMPNHLRELLHFLEQKQLMNIEQIDEDIIKDFLEQSKHRKRMRGEGALSNSYLNKQLQAIKTFSKYLRETGKHSFPLDIMQYKIERNIKAVLTQEEIQLLYKSTEPTIYGLRDKTMLGIYYGCGLRCNEGLQLDVNDILIERGLLYVRKGKNFTERYVPMNTEIIKDVSVYLNEVRPQLIRKEKQGTQFFVSQRGDRINAQSLSL